jgi:hypothetical protein
MDVVKRAAAVTCAPLAAAWFVTSITLGVGCLMISAAGATVYAAGKYIATGKCYNPDPMFLAILNTNQAITNAPLLFLYGQKKTNEPVPVVPQTLDHIKAERTVQDAEAAIIQAQKRVELLDGVVVPPKN